MEKIIIDDMIKALRCVASQDTVDDCYADHENFMHMQNDEHKRIVCGTGKDLIDYISGKEAVECPYHQQKYGCCFEDGDLFWLKDVAELLEELKSYKEAEEQGLLVRLPCKEAYSRSGDFVYLIYDYEIIDLDPTDWCTNATDVEVSEQGKTVFLTREEAEKKLEEMKNEI